MLPIESTRFRAIYDVLQPHFASGRLLLLEIEGGYLFFTSNKLHDSYGKAGSGQWADIPDRFFFALNFKPIVKNGEKKSSLDIELFDYGYKEEREAFLNRVAGLEGLSMLDERKGYTFLLQYPLFSGKEKKAEQETNTQRIVALLREFLESRLPALEAII